MNTIVPCACPANKDGKKCDNLHKIVLEMAQKYPENSNFSNLVGQVKLMTHYYKDENQKKKDTKPANWHRKCLDNIYGKPCHLDGGHENDTLPLAKEVFVNKLHFHPQQLKLAKQQSPLLSENSVPYTIDAKGFHVDVLGLFSQDRLNSSEYWCLPT